MRMKLSHLSIALVPLVAAGCPYDQLSRSLGIAIGGGGGGGSGPNVLLMIQQPLTGTAGAILTPAILVGAADTLGRADTAFTRSEERRVGKEGREGRATEAEKGKETRGRKG